MKKEKYEKYLKMVREDGFLLADIPYRNRTLKLCREAVKSEGAALWFVPRSKQTDKILILAIERDPEIIFDIPKKRLTKEFFLAYLKHVDIETAKLPRNIIQSPAFQEAYAEYKLGRVKLYITDEEIDYTNGL